MGDYNPELLNKALPFCRNDELKIAEESSLTTHWDSLTFFLPTTKSIMFTPKTNLCILGALKTSQFNLVVMLSNLVLIIERG